MTTGNYARTLALWAEGHTAPDIGKMLHITPSTVTEYLKRARAQYRRAGEDPTGRRLVTLIIRDQQARQENP